MARMGGPSEKDLIRERWFRGKLDYKLHAGQLKLRDIYRNSKSQLFVGECSRQLGKSFEAVVDNLELAMARPYQRLRYGTAFHSDLVEFIMPNFEKVMWDCPDDLRPKYLKAQSKFVTYHGSEIKLVGVDRNPNGIRGNALDQITLDEAAFISGLRYLYESVIIPATTHRPQCRIKMISTPPVTEDHDFISFAEEAEMEGGYCKLDIFQNPMLGPQDYARIIKQYESSGGVKSAAWRREYLCERVIDPGLAIIGEWENQYVQDVPRDEYYPFYFKYGSMDMGVRDLTVVLFGYYDYRKAALIIEDEFAINGPTFTTQILQALIKEKEETLWKDMPVRERIADNNNPLLLQDLSNTYGINFNPVEKGRLEEMVNAVKIMVRSGGIIVSPKCKQLSGCLKYGIWEKSRDQFARSKIYGHYDALAALIYLVRNIDRVSNPIPFDFKSDPSNQMIIDYKRGDGNISALREAFGVRK